MEQQYVVLTVAHEGPQQTWRLWLRDLRAHLAHEGLDVLALGPEEWRHWRGDALAVVAGPGTAARDWSPDLLRLPAFLVLAAPGPVEAAPGPHEPRGDGHEYAEGPHDPPPGTDGPPPGPPQYLDPREDTAADAAARVVRRVRAPREGELPGLFTALRAFGRSGTQAWHTPTHSGGLGFTKSPAGRAFRTYYGEGLLRTDISVSVTRLGSLLAHDGLIGEAEAEAARVFGADLTYFVLNGASTADRVAGQYALAPGDIALVDRNCHRALSHVMVLTGARPRYLVPTRNSYGLIGPVPPATLRAPAPVGRDGATGEGAEESAGLAMLTNCTYDGICYDTVRVAELLAARTPRLLFDEAWLAYARFHPLYARRYAMAVSAGTLPDADRPTVFSVQSTHKMLTALSQGAMLHALSAPRAPVDRAALDETYELHGSTSPLYPLMASLDVSTATMRDHGGALIDDALGEAVAFRQAVARRSHHAHTAKAAGRDWFFTAWQPPHVTDPADGATYAFHDAPAALLRGEPACWLLDPAQSWHGFAGLEPGFALLDPLKVTLLCPGGGDEESAGGPGTPAAPGVPAAIVSAWLQTRGIIPEKCNDHTLQVLFSLGSSTAKWQALLQALGDFKERHDADAPLAEVLPELVVGHGERYAGTSLRGLCEELHTFLRVSGHSRLLARTYTTLPAQDLAPGEAYQALRARGREEVPLAVAAHRTTAVLVTLTPTAIPLLVPGENTGAADGPHLRYLHALQERDRTFPGFEQEIHGVRRDPESGDYLLQCLPR